MVIDNWDEIFPMRLQNGQFSIIPTGEEHIPLPLEDGNNFSYLQNYFYCLHVALYIVYSTITGFKIILVLPATRKCHL